MSNDLLAKVAGVLRDIDKDHPELGLRTLAEECDQARTELPQSPPQGDWYDGYREGFRDAKKIAETFTATSPGRVRK
jgi:hypothetical protein